MCSRVVFKWDLAKGLDEQPACRMGAAGNQLRTHLTATARGVSPPMREMGEMGEMHKMREMRAVTL